MFCLTTFTFLDCNHPPAQAILDALSRLPSLASVDFSRTPINTLTPSFAFVALENLSIKSGWKLVSVSGGQPYDIVTRKARAPLDPYTRLSQSLSRRTAELTFSRSFITTNLAFLERVEIEGALFPFGILPTTHFPRLHTLVFYGRPPISQTTPLITLFGGMHALRDLQFRWTARLVDRHDRYIYVPPSLVLPPRATLPALRSLTLSNLAPERDHILHCLPTTLVRLHLPTILEDGEPGASLQTAVNVGLTPAGAAAVARCGCAALRELRMTLADMPAPRLISALAAAFPGLQVLELGQAWYGARDTGLMHSEVRRANSLHVYSR
ncbi:hypothetical protein NEOLEDRAFT_1141212 [Neolentinus lepideus HHB14362 ss-1]|uniref:F-box domain-containing protein n=1 Tax=Neolentinus lepideus HHB14362 ss-1 TaxID=1314782 RepID=A0A165NRY8_9AGAM|nr:hypothetical protein NEOLEDRAFT_1141212 [Neolentinus lepideus HHB14362 ss-1]